MGLARPQRHGHKEKKLAPAVGMDELHPFVTPPPAAPLLLAQLFLLDRMIPPVKPRHRGPKESKKAYFIHPGAGAIVRMRRQVSKIGCNTSGGDAHAAKTAHKCVL